jgi:hypothetical protein
MNIQAKELGVIWEVLYLLYNGRIIVTPTIHR